MNQEAHTTALDGYSQATPLAKFNVSQEIKRIHVDAIASNNLGDQVSTYPAVEKHFELWKAAGHSDATLGSLTQEQMRSFVTSPMAEGGFRTFSRLLRRCLSVLLFKLRLGRQSRLGFFLGNKLGCMGETSGLAILIGAIFLIWNRCWLLEDNDWNGSWSLLDCILLSILLLIFWCRWRRMVPCTIRNSPPINI